MFRTKRRRLVALVTATVTTAAVGAITLPANGLNLGDPVIAASCTLVPTNVVKNCGFEAPVSGSTVPSWTHLVSHDGFVSSVGVHSGSHSLAFGSTTDDDVYTQTIKVSPNTQYIVSAWLDAANGTADPNVNDFTLAATNINHSSDATTIYSGNNLSSGWQQIGGVVTTSTGTTTTLVLRGANTPNHDYVDDVVVTPVPAGCAPIANNLVGNCGFEASSASPWIQSGTDHDSQVSSNTGYGGTHSLRFASTSTDDSWFQVLTVHPHTQYTLSYWVEYWSGTGVVSNDLHVIVSDVPASGGSLKIATANIPNRFWTHVTKTFTTGSGSSAVLMITGANKPDSTYVDDVSVTAVSHVKVAAKGRKVTTTVTGLGGQKVQLERLVGGRWIVVHTWTAPKTGLTKAWTLTVGKAGKYRSVTAVAPGYNAATSSAITVK